MKKIGLCILAIFGGMMVLGCGAHTEKVKTPVEPVRPELVTPVPREERTEGSLWTNDSAMASLFSDIKARKVGDIVTISIVESSSATESASTETGRDSSIKAGVTAFVQPGGSVNDYQSIEACNEAGASMVFALERCFSHH